MRSIIVAFCLIFVCVAPAKADGVAIKDVISRQIAAFQADDFDTAFTFASPTIQGIFGSSTHFGTMVREGYPMVWRPADLTFLELQMIDSQLWQTIMVEDQGGVMHLLDYQMVNGEGGWKINAVRLRQMPAGTV